MFCFPLQADTCSSPALTSIFHLGLWIIEEHQTREKSLSFPLFLNLPSFFNAPTPAPLSQTLYISSQLYPRSYPQTLFKLEEMRPAFLVKEKKNQEKEAARLITGKFLRWRIALKLLLNVLEPTGLVFFFFMREG